MRFYYVQPRSSPLENTPAHNEAIAICIPNVPSLESNQLPRISATTACPVESNEARVEVELGRKQIVPLIACTLLDHPETFTDDAALAKERTFVPLISPTLLDHRETSSDDAALAQKAQLSERAQDYSSAMDIDPAPPVVRGTSELQIPSANHHGEIAIGSQLLMKDVLEDKENVGSGELLPQVHHPDATTTYTAKITTVASGLSGTNNDEVMTSGSVDIRSDYREPREASEALTSAPQSLFGHEEITTTRLEKTVVRKGFLKSCRKAVRSFIRSCKHPETQTRHSCYLERATPQLPKRSFLRWIGGRGSKDHSERPDNNTAAGSRSFGVTKSTVWNRIKCLWAR
ncbi:hypothetical protein HDU93_007493 [Gonapodya sp. JEL0774]|nr:hypothetical protein HDU93_007493 [Gonapodya sp. JEL0774]